MSLPVIERGVHFDGRTLNYIHGPTTGSPNLGILYRDFAECPNRYVV